jgi:WD40 repeat protein
LKAQNGLLYTCRGDGFINCYNLTTNKLLRTIEGHSGSCNSIISDDQFLYTGGNDKLIKKWRLASSKLEMIFKGCSETLNSIKGHSEIVRQIILFENFLFSASFDSTAAQFDKTTGKLIRRFSVDTPRQVASVAASADGQWLFTGIGLGDPNANLVQWRVFDGSRVRTMNGVFESFIYYYLHRPFAFSYRSKSFR